MKNIIYTLLTLVISTASMSTHAAAVSLSLSPVDTTIIGLSKSFSIDVIGSYSADAKEVDVLLGGASDLLFDDSIIKLNSVTINAPVDIASSLGDLGVAGKVGAFGFASFSGVADGSFNLATLEFETVGLGTSLLELSNANSVVFEWANSDGNLVAFSSTDGSVTVSSVPVPAAAWMFISGLAGLLQISRRKV